MFLLRIRRKSFQPKFNPPPLRSGTTNITFDINSATSWALRMCYQILTQKHQISDEKFPNIKKLLKLKLGNNLLTKLFFLLFKLKFRNYSLFLAGFTCRTRFTSQVVAIGNRTRAVFHSITFTTIPIL